MTRRASVLSRHFLSTPLLLALALAGCQPVVKKEPVTDSGVVRVQPQPQSLDEDLLYQLLAAEFAGVRGRFQESVDFYMQAAEHADDVQVAERAAHIAVFSQQYEKARQAVRRWQELGGDPIAIARVNALIHVHLENLDPALDAIELLLIEDGRVADHAVGALGHILQKEAKPAFALAVLEKLNQRHPGHPRLLLLQARLEAGAGHYAEAMESVDQALVLESDSADAYLIRAQALAGLGRQEEAVQAVAKAVDFRPDDNRLRIQYGRMLVQMKSYDRAWDQFMQLHQNLPDNEHVLLSLGLLSIETGKNDLARQYLQKLIDTGRSGSQAHYYLARIQQNDNEIEAAIDNYRAVQGGGFLLDARIREAALLAQIGKVDKALEKLKKLSRPGHGDEYQVKVYLAQGEVLRRANREREAMSLYNHALKEMPENIELLYARALTAEKLDMLDITESDLRMVLIHEPDNANALNALGYTLADRTERLQEAKDYILRAAKLLPDDPAVLDSLGWVYYRLGEMEKAVEWLRKAFARLEDAEIAAHLGEVLWVSGQLEEAAKIWQRGLEVKSDHPILLDTIKRFKK